MQWEGSFRCSRALPGRQQAALTGPPLKPDGTLAG